MKFIHYLITVFKDNLEGDRAYIGRFFDKSTGFAQPDGLENEQCSIIQLFSIHNINAWHDVACAYNKILNFICETEMISNENVIDCISGDDEQNC
ncbi:hypothetical protein AM593_01242, partial [Mytilus galloprovincialis]